MCGNENHRDIIKLLAFTGILLFLLLLFGKNVMVVQHTMPEHSLEKMKAEKDMLLHAVTIFVAFTLEAELHGWQELTDMGEKIKHILLYNNLYAFIFIFYYLIWKRYQGTNCFLLYLPLKRIVQFIENSDGKKKRLLFIT